MADWQTESLIYRLRKALDAESDAEQRDALTRRLNAANAKLTVSPPDLTQAKPDSAKPKKTDRFGGKGLWERQRP